MNGCDDCPAAHTYFGRTFARFDDAEVAAARSGSCTDATAAAAVAKVLAENRGAVSPADVDFPVVDRLAA